MRNAPGTGLEHSPVTVVIPTVGRPSLRAAVGSAISQTTPPREILVVADMAEADWNDDLLVGLDGPVEVLFTGGGAGGGGARAIGTNAAHQPWIAYLDDDDSWLAEKLEKQLAVARQNPGVDFLSCRVVSVDNHGRYKIAPKTVFRDGPMDEYLFRSRALSVRRNLVPTATLLVNSDLAKRVNWRSLKRHQDWDFVLRCSRQCAHPLVQLEDALTVIHIGSGSITGSPDWLASLTWASGERMSWTNRAYADFVVGQVLRSAIQARDLSGVRRVAKELRGGAHPSLKAFALAASGLLPRGAFNALMHASRRRRTGEPA